MNLGQFTGASVREADIRGRAYQIYLQRGNFGGDAVSDWLQAERELNAELEKLLSDLDGLDRPPDQKQ